MKTATVNYINTNTKTQLLETISDIKNKKAQLTQRETRDSSACLKAHRNQNLSSLIPAADI